MYEHIETLRRDLMGYREAVDLLSSSQLIAPSDWRRCFSDISICASRLYLDYLLVIKYLPLIETVTSEGHTSERSKADAVRELQLRERIQRELGSAPYWKHFNPNSALSKLAGLHSRQDFTDRFAVHLPEIYEESFRVERYTNAFLQHGHASALTGLAIALQHIGRNHILFVLQALEWAADKESWSESLVI